VSRSAWSLPGRAVDGVVKLCVHPSELAPGLMVGHDVQLGSELELGGNVVIHSGTVVGDGCEIQDGAVLGKRPRFGKLSSASRDGLDALIVEGGCVICTGAVVYAGARIGARAIIGDQAHVRERAKIGSDTVIGRGSAVDNDVTIGNGVRVQSNCYLTAYSIVEDDVFIAPGVVTTNDDTMGRHPADYALRGATFRRACRVGGGTVLVPGVEIGEEAFIAAGAVVCDDVPPRAVMMGVPARQKRSVPDEDLWGRWH
jgi:acetyltransferase-like isoleucine patch superfamily enzyme